MTATNSVLKRFVCARCGRTVAALYGWGQMICWDCTEADA